MTSNCIDSILNTVCNTEIRIIVIDNGSDNGSGELLKERYRGNDLIEFVFAKKNLGFARGNNIAYLHLIEHYNPDYIVFLNNDVIIEQTDILSRIQELYVNEGFDILGPDIYCPRLGQHQNPMRLRGYSIREVSRIINKRKIGLKFLPLHYVFIKMKYMIRYNILTNMIRHVFNINRERIWYMTRHYMPVLHGSCIIMSKKYFCDKDEVFDSRTFLYMEEAILHYKCVRDNRSIVYSPLVKVLHLADVSTRAYYKNDYAILKMRYRNIICSGNVLLSIMTENLTERLDSDD